MFFAHGVEVIESNFTIKKRIRSILSPIKKMVFKNAKKVFTVSDFTAKLLRDKCNMVHDKICIVYNGVDPKYFQEKEKPLHLIEKYKTQNKRVFLTISRLDDYKGIDNAILAFKKVVIINPDFIYLIGGIGQDFDRLKNMIKENGLEQNIILCEKILQNEIADYYNLCDVFILLSRYDSYTPNFEGFGLVFSRGGSLRSTITSWIFWWHT